MKNKIALKLLSYFTAILLFFSIVIGGTFSYFFTRHTVNIYKIDLEKKSTSISQALTDYISNNGVGKGQSGLGSYMKFLDDIAMTEVWVVDESLSPLLSHHKNSNLSTSPLPSGAEKIVNETFSTKSTAFLEGSNNMLKGKSLAVSAPILESNDKVIGAVVLYSPIESVSKDLGDVLKVLGFSILIALIISGIITIGLSLSFTKPLNKMKHTATALAEGDYTARTNIVQKDEIGDLANTIDLLSTRLDEASKESENLENMRKEFISNISHELRTPITVLRGSLEALKDGVITDSEQIREYYDELLSESIHLERLVNDLLELSRLQNTDFNIEFSPINLCDVINDSTRAMKKIATTKNISIISEVPIKELIILGDYSRLRQMIINVLDNGIKFSSVGQSVIIKLTTEKELSLSITDKGHGIPLKDIPYIFDRFHKDNSSENRKGTGLGLAITKQIADRHQIKIAVKSIPEDGTTFSFIFPKEILVPRH